MLKIDKQLIDEILGQHINLKTDYCNCWRNLRVYSVYEKNGKEKILIVQTPDSSERNIFSVKDIINCAKNYNFKKTIDSVVVRTSGKYTLTIVSC